jgi:N-acetylmuramoyl-L-alanine amidase
MRSGVRTAIAWVGLLTMGLCMCWLQSIPRREKPVQASNASRREPIPLVVLDPGHGGKDSGAMCGSISEKDLTLDVAHRLDRKLREAGLSTLMTRGSDNYISLSDRAAMTNRAGDCILVSIHFNDANKAVSSGVETYYAARQTTRQPLLASWLPFLRVSSDTPNLESQSLAGFIQDALVTRTHAVNRGTKTQQFFVIANVDHPAVLVEGGFISNKDDISKLGNPEYREQIATAMTEGILHYRDVLKASRQ